MDSVGSQIKADALKRIANITIVKSRNAFILDCEVGWIGLPSQKFLATLNNLVSCRRCRCLLFLQRLHSLLWISRRTYQHINKSTLPIEFTSYPRSQHQVLFCVNERTCTPNVSRGVDCQPNLQHRPPATAKISSEFKMEQLHTGEAWRQLKNTDLCYHGCYYHDHKT